ncbi:MAG TPA: alpha/beta hydrolase [Blastocatellia bacterium]|nr:alpha/beta hydrolase [Blastocatellia bacterium]
MCFGERLDELRGSFHSPLILSQNLCLGAYNADVALSLIDALHLHDVVVVGHSYGGGTALAAALRHPGQVKSFVIVDSAAYRIPENPSPLYRIISIPGFGTGFARLLGPLLAPGKIRDGLLAEFPGGAVPDGFIELRTKIWSQPRVTTSIARETLRANQGLEEMSRRYREIGHSVFIVAQADNPTRRQGVERLQRDIPGAELLLLSGTGHYIQFQKTPELIGVIEKAAAVPETGKAKAQPAPAQTAKEADSSK